jgi:hypothetical protein
MLTSLLHQPHSKIHMEDQDSIHLKGPRKVNQDNIMVIKHHHNSYTEALEVILRNHQHTMKKKLNLMNVK